jgi:DNA-binding transcriptional ArsR family regulator
MLSRGERTVSQIHAEVTVAMPDLSRHMAILRECGLVRQRKAGHRRYYRLDRARLRRVHQWLEQFASRPE